GADIDRIDAGAGTVAQSEGFGALGKTPFLARLDKDEAAFAAAQEFDGAQGIGEAGCGAGGGCATPALTIARPALLPPQQPRRPPPPEPLSIERRASLGCGKSRPSDEMIKPKTAIAVRIAAATARSNACSAPPPW